MRKAKEILRLRYELGLTHRQIGRSCEVSHVTVGDYLRRAEAAGLRWPLPPEVSEAALEALLAPAPKPAPRPLPAMEQLRQELSRRGVTLRLLWEEYRAIHPDGYGYTQFCDYYRRWRQQLEPSLRQPYKAGEKLFVDWAGQTVPLWDAATGLSRPGYIFLATLGASNYTYAEAFDNMRQAAWSVGHVNAFAFMGGVPKILVPDYVPRNIIGVMCPTTLCGRGAT
jgi:transposase